MIKTALHNYATSMRRKFKSDRSTTIGASEIGQCARRVYYVKNHADYDEDFVESWGAARRGNVFEDHFFVPAVRAHFGAKLLYSGKQQKRMVVDKLSATPDGLLIDQPKNALAHLFVPDIGPSRCIVLEIKTIDPRIKLSEPKPEHVFQAHVQLGLFRETTKYKPDYAVIPYTNASFFDDVIEFPVRFDPKIYAEAKKRAARILSATAPDELKPEGWIAGGKECEHCPFVKACNALRGDVPDNDLIPTDSQFIAEMADLARAERECNTRVSVAEAEQRDMQEKIKARLREKGLRKVKDDTYSISWASIKGRPSYDWPGLRAALAKAKIDIQKYETVGDSSDRLTVSYRSRGNGPGEN